MKKKKIGFCGFLAGNIGDDNLMVQLLKERYEIEYSDDPDFLFVSNFCNPFEYMRYDCVRILYTGEPFVPDFNVFDYAIGMEHMSLPDAEGNNRYFRLPLCFDRVEGIVPFPQALTRTQAEEVLRGKKYFCNFIYAHRSSMGQREAILDTLQRYKRVESAGSFLNNMPDGRVVPFSKEKLAFLRMCKFTVACESVRYPGFVTEKIADPFFANSVPIYYGDPLVEKEFNPEAMIHLGAFSNLEEGIERVKEVDQDDEQYLKILMAPKLASEHYVEDLCDGLREFLFNIFDQEKEEAFRRLRLYAQKAHEDHLKAYAEVYQSPWYQTQRKMNMLKKRAGNKIRKEFLRGYKKN